MKQIIQFCMKPKLFVLAMVLIAFLELSVTSFPMTPNPRSKLPTGCSTQLRQLENEHNADEISLTSNKNEDASLKTLSSKRVFQQRKRRWVERSAHYYKTVMRDKNRRARGQIQHPKFNERAKALEYHRKNFAVAQNLYFARNQIKVGNLNYAESIYRKLVDELLVEANEANGTGPCNNAQLAISTLLLCLLLQRKHQIKETRAAFVQFFQIVMSKSEVEECACSAKVLQAFALFEMKQGHVKKSYELIQLAVRMDNELEPVLSWKQFRDAKMLTSSTGPLI